MGIHGSGLAFTLFALMLRLWLFESGLRVAASDEQSGAAGRVNRVVADWRAAEEEFMGRSARGFSGTIQFLDAKGNAVPADGEVVIHLFDNQGAPEHNGKPMHNFRYPAESWRALRTPEPGSPAYRVFVPYTRGGVQKAECRLQVRFSPAKGRGYVRSDVTPVAFAR